MKIETSNTKAFNFIDLILFIALIALLLAIFSIRIRYSQHLAERNRLKEEATRLFVQFPADITGKVFRVHYVYTNNLAKVMLVGETASGPKSVSFISSVPTNSSIPVAGKFYTATENGLAEVVGSATEPTFGQQR